MAKTRHLVGHVGVNSGTVIIMDPANLDNMQNALGGLDPRLSVAASESEAGRGISNVVVNETGICIAVIANTDHGDGVFPVYFEETEEGGRLIIDLY